VVTTPRPASPRKERSTSALRAQLLRLRPCLDKLTRDEWGVLQLRAGSATTRGLDAREIGRRLGLSRARVLAVERRGVRRLKGMRVRDGDCQDGRDTAAPVAPKKDAESLLSSVPIERPEPREVALTLPLLLALASLLWLGARRRIRRKPSAPA
jgi:hypothetical protein